MTQVTQEAISETTKITLFKINERKSKFAEKNQCNIKNSKLKQRTAIKFTSRYKIEM